MVNETRTLLMAATPERRRFNSKERVALFLAADGRCQQCGAALEAGWHADHIHPYSKSEPYSDDSQRKTSRSHCTPTSRWRSPMKRNYRKVDAEPLIQLAASQHPGSDAVGITTVGLAAQALNIAASELHRWRHQGIPYYTADRLAIRLGYHPALVWEEWWTLTNSYDEETGETTSETHPTPRGPHRSSRTLHLVANPDSPRRNAS